MRKLLKCVSVLVAGAALAGCDIDEHYSASSADSDHIWSTAVRDVDLSQAPMIGTVCSIADDVHFGGEQRDVDTQLILGRVTVRIGNDPCIKAVGARTAEFGFKPGMRVFVLSRTNDDFLAVTPEALRANLDRWEAALATK